MSQVELLIPFGAQGEGQALEGRIFRMERHLRRFVGVNHCVVAPNPVTALRMVLRAAGIGEGDKVLCSAFGPQSTLQTLLELGAIPEFVDINPNAYNLDPFCLEYVIGRTIRTKCTLPKALIAVDLFGLPCNYTAIEEICERHGVLLIEDMTQSLGASHRGRKTGQFGRFAIASFRGTKLPGSLEEDGIIFCHSAEDEQTLRRHLGGSGQEVREYPTQDSAALAADVHLTMMEEQLRQFRDEFERRQAVAQRYREQLSAHVSLQRVGERCESAYTQFVVAMDCEQMRAFVMDKLLEEQIPCSPYDTIPLHQCRELQRRVILANAERISQKLLVLPMHSYLTNHVVDFVCEKLVKAVDAYPRTVIYR